MRAEAPSNGHVAQVGQHHRRRHRHCQTFGHTFVADMHTTSLIVIQLLLLLHLTGHKLFTPVEAVNVQRLNVPDLVVIEQLNQQQQQHQQQLATNSRQVDPVQRGQNINLDSQPEAASLINSQDLTGEQQQSQIVFECLISFDKRKDKNLVIKWHHDDRTEPIYQWIPELNKRSIALPYRPYIAPLVSQHQSAAQIDGGGISSQQQLPHQQMNNSSNSIQLLEAGFRLVRPSKELGGKYTCSVISSQNDDSKWKKMIVYTPPRHFRFNASRTDIGALLAIQRERLIQPSMIGPVNTNLPPAPSTQHHQLPLAYRMKGFESQLQSSHSPTTISPQMYSTIDYVNVNQQRNRQSSTSPWLISQPASAPATSGTNNLDQHLQPTRQPIAAAKQAAKAQNGVKLVCDIDQVFPVPEVSIYRLGKVDGSHPDKLPKLDTRIERNPLTGLYHVQVTSIMEDDELQMKYGQNEPVYFECLIALTNLELSKYADNKRNIIYRPGLLTNNALGQQASEDINFEQVGNSANSQTTITILLGAILSWSLWYTFMTVRLNIC